MGIDKLMAINSLTEMERMAAELRTKMAMMEQPDTSAFNDFDQLIIATALRIKSSNELLKMNFRLSTKIIAEADKWYK